MSHTYDAFEAMAIYEQLPEFVGPLKNLVDTLAGVDRSG